MPRSDRNVSNETSPLLADASVPPASHSSNGVRESALEKTSALNLPPLDAPIENPPASAQNERHDLLRVNPAPSLPFEPSQHDTPPTVEIESSGINSDESLDSTTVDDNALRAV